jgi:hypothetical protein
MLESPRQDYIYIADAQDGDTVGESSCKYNVYACVGREHIA